MQAPPVLAKPVDDSQGAVVRAYAATVEAYGRLAIQIKGWQDWALSK